jgi:putative transcriptional regulator
MSIIANHDVMMGERKMSLNELSETVNISLVNLAKL